MVVGGGFEPPNSKRADLQSAAFDRSATPPSSWSGRRESNPPSQLGRLEHYHYATPASQNNRLQNSVALKFVKEYAKRIFNLTLDTR